MRERLDNDQSNQNLPEVWRENLFRRARRALPQMRLEDSAGDASGTCSRGRLVRRGLGEGG